MTRESTDTDTAEQVIDSFRILASDKVRDFIKGEHFTCRQLLLVSIFLIKHIYYSCSHLSCPMNFAVNCHQIKLNIVSKECHHTKDPMEFPVPWIICHLAQLYMAKVICKELKTKQTIFLII